MPNKVCPKCTTSLHVRCSSCSCGHQFYEKKTVVVPTGLKTGGPKKKCPSCSNMLHVKRATCPCGHVFYKTENGPEPIVVPVTDEVKASMIALMSSLDDALPVAPKKICPECNDEIHARKAICTCGHVFYETKIAKSEQYDWTNLHKGDVIKSIQGHGPYWVNTKTDDRIYNGVYGTYTVSKVDSQGLWVREANAGKLSSKSYDEFMYMGAPSVSDKLNTIIREPHKIILIKEV